MEKSFFVDDADKAKRKKANFPYRSRSETSISWLQCPLVAGGFQTAVQVDCCGCTVQPQQSSSRRQQRTNYRTAQQRQTTTIATTGSHHHDHDDEVLHRTDQSAALGSTFGSIIICFNCRRRVYYDKSCPSITVIIIFVIFIIWYSVVADLRIYIDRCRRGHLYSIKRHGR